MSGDVQGCAVVADRQCTRSEWGDQSSGDLASIQVNHGDGVLSLERDVSECVGVIDHDDCGLVTHPDGVDELL